LKIKKKSLLYYQVVHYNHKSSRTKTLITGKVKKQREKTERKNKKLKIDRISSLDFYE